jgi:4-diphosphocytidyl-2-C-methyl-D-erythritol kinase
VTESHPPSAAPARHAADADCIRLHPPAKINLNLLVNRKTESGYHPLDSVVVHISLHDAIELSARDDGEVTFEADGIECGPLQSNLAHAAACVLRRLARSVGLDVPGVDIRLTKQIPPGSGLGGGSSDAASVLMGLNDLWQLSRSREQLAVLAAELGSDVPLFLGPPALRMTGYGDTVERVDVHPFWALLHTPDLHCPTRAVYRAFDADPPETAVPLAPATFAERPSSWRGLLVNQLATAAMRVEPELAERFERLNALLPAPVCVTGSGSAMFMIADTQAEARRALAALPEDLRVRTQVIRNLSASSGKES